VLVSSLLDKIKQVPIYMSSRHQETLTNTTQCPSVQGAKVQRHIWRSTTRALPIVRLSFRLGAHGRWLSFESGTLEQLVQHGLHALRETLQQDKELTIKNTSIGIIGPASDFETNVPKTGPFRILEDEAVDPFLKTIVPKESTDAPPAAAASSTSTSGAPAAPADEDVQMQE
jgi:hypothetical protein